MEEEMKDLKALSHLWNFLPFSVLPTSTISLASCYPSLPQTDFKAGG